MNDIGSICARVRISNVPEDKGPVQWTSEQVYRIARRSPVFEKQIHRLLLYDQYEWHIDPQIQEVGFDALTAHSLLGKMGQANEVGDVTEIDDFSKYCCALWYFQVVPSNSHFEWQATSGSGEANPQIIQRKPVPAGARTGVSGGSGYLSPNRLSPRSDGWCWNSRPNHPSWETSLKLANIALVVGQVDQFAREIKTVIWNWNWSVLTLADTITPVERLQKSGALGLDNKRKEEMKEVIDWFDDYIARRPKCPKEVQNVRKRDIQQLSQTSTIAPRSIYEWIKALQSKLISTAGTVLAGQTHVPPGGQPTLPVTPQGAMTDAFGRVWNIDTASKFQRYAYNKAHPPEDKMFVEDMFQAAHEFIENRQRDVVDELMSWRNAQVQKWDVSLLKDLDLPPVMQHEAGAPNDGASTQPGGSSSQEDSGEGAVVSPVDREAPTHG